MKRLKVNKGIVWSIITGCLIGLFVLILSYTHTTALFERSGYSDIFAHIGVWAFELTFLFGTVNVVASKLTGEKVSASSRFVLVLGVLINLYSNITSGIAHNVAIVFFVVKGIPIDEAVLIGALIPCLIFATELIISDAIRKHLVNKQTNSNSNKHFKRY